jgi:hypothetical protein
MNSNQRTGLGILIMGIALFLSSILTIPGSSGAYEGIGRILVTAGRILLPLCLVGIGALALSGKTETTNETTSKKRMAILVTITLVAIAGGAVIAWTG